MLTLYDNIQRYMKRYNRKRGSALLMVLMTMSVLIVVGTSMLYISLSSFTTSLADTNQSKAYNATLTVCENLQANIDTLLKANESELDAENSMVTLKFSNSNKFNDATVREEYTTVNGVKVSVTLSNANATMPTPQEGVKRILVKTIGEYKGQKAMISFYADYYDTTRQKTIEDTYDNSFVMSSSLGSDKKNPELVFKRIEGDISIDCYDRTYNAEGAETSKKMVTRTLNPMVTEGITGSVYANGDLIIGSADNIVKVQGNIYVDGNLTIRGLDLGINLPAVYKKEFSDNTVEYSHFLAATTGKTYISYWTNGKYFDVGSLSYKYNVCQRIGTGAVAGDAMYDFINDEYVPLQAYDEVSHYTLVDKGISSFWTKEYKYKKTTTTVTFNGSGLENSAYEITDEEWVEIIIDLDDVTKNEKYYGAAMYENTGTDEAPVYTPILMYPEGGNIYCSGDIIFDTVNVGNFETFDTSGNVIPYYTLSYEADATTVAVNQTYIRGDVFCYGRMIIDPCNLIYNTEITGDNNYSISTAFTTNRYLSQSDINAYSSKTAFQGRLATFISAYNTKLANDGILNEINVSNTEDRVIYSRLDTENSGGIIVTDWDNEGYPNFTNKYTNKQGFLDAVRAAGTKAAVQHYKEVMIDVANEELEDNDTNLFNAFLVQNLQSGYMPSSAVGATLRMPKFATTSNLNISNYYDALKYNYRRKYNSSTEKMVANDLPEGATASSYNAEATDSTGYLTPVTTQQLDLLRTTVSHGKTYDSALTIKYADIAVNSVTALGSINVIKSKLAAFDGEFESGGTLTTKTSGDVYTLLATNYISGEYGQLNFEDIIRRNNPTMSAAEIAAKLKEYWTIEGSSFTPATTNLIFEVVDFYKPAGESDRRVIVLQARKRRDWGTTIYDIMYLWDFKNEIIRRRWDGQQENTNNTKKDLDDLGDALLDLVKAKDIDNITFKASDPIFLEFTSASLSSGDKDVYSVLSRGDTAYDSILFSDYDNLVVNFNDVDMLTLFTSNAGTTVGGVADDMITAKKNYVGKSNSSDLAADTIYNTYFDGVNESCYPFKTKNYGMYLKEKENATYLDTVNKKKSVTEDGVTTVYYSAKISDVFDEIANRKEGHKFAEVEIAQVESINSSKVNEMVQSGELYEYNYIEDLTGTAANPIFDVATLPGNDIGNTLSFVDGTIVGHNGYFKTPKASNHGNIWCYTTSILGFHWFIAEDTSTKDDGATSTTTAKLQMFANAGNPTSTTEMRSGQTANYLAPIYSFSSDPMRSSNTIDPVALASSYYRSQVDYTINHSLYLNFSGSSYNTESGGSNGGYNSNTSGSVKIGADNSRLRARRMQFNVDTSESDIYMYINAPRPDASQEDIAEGLYDYGVIFEKCTFQVTGENNFYIVLVDDTKVAANAYPMEFVLESEDKSDDFVGTHFRSGRYYDFTTGFYEMPDAPEEDDEDESWWEAFKDALDEAAQAATAITQAYQKLKIVGTYSEEYTKVGDLFVIGSGKNVFCVGRGGSINGYVYLANGTYMNRSVAAIDIGVIPFASSGNNEATIVASEIRIIGSNVGKLIFTSFDQSASGGSGAVVSDIFTFTTVSQQYGHVWEFYKYSYNVS